MITNKLKKIYRDLSRAVDDLSFGTVEFVRDWMGIHGAVGKPANEYPKRPVNGFDVSREEVNRTPDKLPAVERAALFQHCDDALRRIVKVLEPSLVVGIGEFCDSEHNA